MKHIAILSLATLALTGCARSPERVVGVINAYCATTLPAERQALRGGDVLRNDRRSMKRKR